MTNMQPENYMLYGMYPTGERWPNVGFPAEHGGLGHDGHEDFEITEPATEEGRRRAQELINNYFSPQRAGVEVQGLDG